MMPDELFQKAKRATPYAAIDIAKGWTELYTERFLLQVDRLGEKIEDAIYANILEYNDNRVFGKIKKDDVDYIKIRSANIIMSYFKNEGREFSYQIKDQLGLLRKEKEELRVCRSDFELEKEVFHNDNKLKMEEISYQKDKNRYEKENLDKDREIFGRDLKTHMEQKETIAKLESENTTIKEVVAAQSESIKEYKALVKDLTEKLASISKSAVEKEIKFPELNFTNKNKQ